MRIGEFYTVKRDQYCFILTYEKEGGINPKTGNPVKTIRTTYHGSLEQALNYVVKEEVGGENIQEVLDSIKEVKGIIHQFCEDFKAGKFNDGPK